MSTTNPVFRISDTFTAEQRALVHNTFGTVGTLLRHHRNIAFAFSCCELVNCYSLDTAVKLMLIVNDGDPVPDQLIHDLHPDYETPERIEAAEMAVADCFALLRNRGLPFTLLTHVHGEEEIGYQFIQDGEEFPFTAIANAVGAEVESLGALPAVVPGMSGNICPNWCLPLFGIL